MFSVSSVNISYPGRDLLRDISFIINARDRIALTGKNGSGKTTLLNLIGGLNSPDSGSIVIPEGKTTGYLPQELRLGSKKTVYDEALSAFGEVITLQEEIEKINEHLESHPGENTALYLRKLSELHHKYDRLSYLDGHKIHSQVERVLKGLGFAETDMQRPLSEFSGGWQMRVELAKILLRRPDLILLDEPTNHLDIESIIWLEDFLRDYPGAVVLVSHDRMFMDHICQRTPELVFGKLYDYPVNFSRFLELRMERMESQLAAARNQDRMIQQAEQFVRRFRAKSTKARQVQSKVKMLAKIEKIEIDDFDNHSMNFRFPKCEKSGQVVVEAADAGKTYGSHTVIEGLSFSITRGEKIAFVGRNGEGKSTLVKMICAEIPFTGKLNTGFHVNLGYYAQIQERTLDDNKTILQTMEDMAGDEWNSTRIRTLLGAFLFGEDDIGKKVKVLSGGEKSRLALARLLLKPCNLLILDEPTNHLDITAKEVLKHALMAFEGTLILVSHDRDFLRGLTTRTFEFRDKKIKEHLGDIDDFLENHGIETFREFEAKKQTVEKKLKTAQKQEINKEKYLQKKELDREIRRLRRELEQCEEEIEKLEKKIATLEKEMQQESFYTNHLVAGETIAEHAKLNKQMETLLLQWESVHEKLEKSKEEPA